MEEDKKYIDKAEILKKGCDSQIETSINNDSDFLSRWLASAAGQKAKRESSSGMLAGGETSRSNFKTSHCKILEIHENSVTAKVLINKEERTFQKRRFDIEPLSELNLKVNDFVEITIITNPGQRIFNYQKVVDVAAIKPLFEKQTHFQNLENSDFFKPLPVNNEDNV